MSGSFSFVQIQLQFSPFERKGGRKCWNTPMGQCCFLAIAWKEASGPWVGPGPAARMWFPPGPPQNLFLGWPASFPQLKPPDFHSTFGQTTSPHQMLCTLPSASPQSPAPHPSSPSPHALPCRPPSQFIPLADLIHLTADVLNVSQPLLPMFPPLLPPSNLKLSHTTGPLQMPFSLPSLPLKPKMPNSDVSCTQRPVSVGQAFCSSLSCPFLSTHLTPGVIKRLLLINKVCLPP